jgi:hypothetical protein
MDIPRQVLRKVMWKYFHIINSSAGHLYCPPSMLPNCGVACATPDRQLRAPALCLRC